MSTAGKSIAHLPTGASTNHKSNQQASSTMSHKGGRAQLSQEQFEMIMSEQEENVKRNNNNNNLINKQLQLKSPQASAAKDKQQHQPTPTATIGEQNNIDIRDFYEELLNNTNSVSIQVATNLPVVIANQQQQ